jgi:cobalamin biosynthesis protein CobD/CbiB
MAGALGIELEKVGFYRLGAPARLPQGGDIGTAVELLRRAAMWTMALVWLLERSTELSPQALPVVTPPKGYRVDC